MSVATMATSATIATVATTRTTAATMMIAATNTYYEMMEKSN